MKFTKSVSLFFVSIFLLTGFALTACSEESSLTTYCTLAMDDELEDLGEEVDLRSLTNAQRNALQDALIADCIDAISGDPCASELGDYGQCVAGVSKREWDAFDDQEDKCEDQLHECQGSDEECDARYDACIKKIKYPCKTQENNLHRCDQQNYKARKEYYDKLEANKNLKAKLTEFGIDYGHYFDD